MTNTTNPTDDEAVTFSIRAYRGIDVGLGQADPLAAIAQKLETQYPDHLILVQAGKFLHGFDRTAYALATLKKYRLKLIGTSADPHIRVGFPAGNFKRRLWSMVEEFGIPYVVALGTQATGHTVYISEKPTGNASVLAAVSEDIIAEVIADMRQQGEVNKSAAQLMLSNSDVGFQLKSKTQDLDTQITLDLMKLPRDVRSMWGENVRACMARVIRAVMAYGLEENKPALLRLISADVDLLKHYICQAQKFNSLKIAFEHRATLAVELGKIIGGLLRSQQVKS